MATEYSKKTVADLQEILKSRSLPHTGKKAELIWRLQQNDTEKLAAAPASSSKEEQGTEGWAADASAASTDARAAAIAAGGKGQPANPPAVPNQAVDTDPSKTSDLKVEPPTQQGEDGADPKKEEPEKDFTSGIKETSLDEEMAKREKRAARFGTAATEDDDAKKALERAKKFGVEAKAVKGLDQALPERSRKRGRGADDGGGQRGRNKRSTPAREGGGGGGKAGKGAGWMGEKDSLAAEARKKRFAAA